MIRFEDLVEKVRAYSPAADVELLRRAYVFSAFAMASARSEIEKGFWIRPKLP